MIVGLGHRAGVGKDTAAAGLSIHGFYRVAFADALKALALDANPHVYAGFDVGRYQPLKDVVGEIGWESAKRYPEVRALLQRLGVAARDLLGSDVWVEAAWGTVRTARLRGYSVVITDVRFPNEFDRVRREGGVLIRIDRPGVDPANDHVSEHALDGADWDAVVVNDGTPDQLRYRVLGSATATAANHVLDQAHKEATA